MIPISMELVREHLRKIAEVPCSRAFYEELHIIEPMKQCETCKGVPQHHAPGACCGVCHGLGQVRLTVTEIRAAYAKVRARACVALSCAPRVFDDLVARWLPEDPKPGHWLHAARELARRGKG